MTHPGEGEKAALVEKLARKAGRDRGKDGARFVRQYYAQVAPEDILETPPDALYGAALSLYRFLERRTPGEAQIRVFNPDAERDGWAAPATIVEIVNDDMPFLVDSVTEELTRHGMTPRLLIHPILSVARDRAGRLAELHEPGKAPDGARAESAMHVEIPRRELADHGADLARRLMSVLDDVRAAIEDWPTMRRMAAEMIAELDARPPAVPPGETREAVEFLRWIDDNHFTFLGYRDYAFAEKGGRTTLNVVRGSGLGILRGESVVVFEGMTDGDVLPPDIADFVKKPILLLINKANKRSTVHRAVPLDTIAVKRFDPQGRVVGERLFVGLFTSVAYNRAARDIPLLRRKVDNVVARSGFTPASHNGKALLHILDTLPRDELFQIPEDELLETSLGIMHLNERHRVALFVHRDPFGRFVTCLIYVPRDRFSTQLRQKIQAIVAEGFAGTVSSFTVHVSEEALARLNVIVALDPDRPAPRSVAEIERALAEAARDWSDDLSQALAAAHGGEAGLHLFRNYDTAFPPAYRERFAADAAVADIAKIDSALATGMLAANLYRAGARSSEACRLKIYSHYGPIPLSDVLPMIENMGVRVIEEVPFNVAPRHAESPFWIHDFGLATREGVAIDLTAVKDKFEAAFLEVWRGEAENDGFNRLVIEAGLDSRAIVVLRAYCKYLRQAGIPFSQSYMEDTLAKNAKIASGIVRLFEAMFDPDRGDGAERRAARIRKEIEHALERVENLDEDRMLRRFVNLVEATLRTNYYQRDADGKTKPGLALKLDSRAIDELPLPRPLVEVMVYSPRVEAIHLRGGKVARGGIRWSDRREDFRTEILGLMKAQMTKNAVIVPVGAKGGFVVKRPPPPGNREAFAEEGVACYRTFMRALLDITDNIVDGKVAPPDRVVRRDGDDTYLVVAADKGTATFSDIANSIAREYGFWLDDAFASGGSAGYDHKKMGITARGAWESVKRHFRELGTDIQSEDFTCVGVGDMSGDVFGNGMLLSRHTRLIGAFNHLHVFVDPDPDPEASFAERKRLFALPRSSWSDYDAKLISKGGGVFDRKAKSIATTEPMRKAFGLPNKDTITPNELVRAMLKAKVDLLWFGGIGTFVKAHGEAHAEVGDRANDPLRIDGREICARVVGEGANLGVTQLGRIECALSGGRINTDFIDNSAGVDTSDHEVNVKILFGEAMRRTRLTLAQRDELLRGMTDEVAGLVLIDNYRQAMAITHAESQGAELLDEHARFMRALERAGRLNRAVEFLPDDEAIAERRQKRIGLTRPELAVLLAYAKITLFEDLLDSDVPDDPYLTHDIGLYFPSALRKRYAKLIAEHPLRREISATYLTNSLVNRMGPSFVNEMEHRTAMPRPEIARAYLMARQVFDFRGLWAEIEALDNKMPAKTQVAMNHDIMTLARRGTQWFLRAQNSSQPIDQVVEAFRDGAAALADGLDEMLTDDLRTVVRDRARAFHKEGAPEALAHRMGALPLYASALDIVRIARSAGRKVGNVAPIYFALGARFGFNWLRRAAQRVPAESEWQRMALAAIIDDLYTQQCNLATEVLDTAGGGPAADTAVESWIAIKNHTAHRIEDLLREFRTVGGVDLAMLTVAAREIRALVQG